MSSENISEMQELLRWIGSKAKARHYSDTTARTMTTALERLTEVVEPGEIQDLPDLTRKLDELVDRWLRGNPDGSPLTAKAYASRSRRAIADYLAFRENPAGWTTKPRRQGRARPKAAMDPTNGTAAEQQPLGAPGAAEEAEAQASVTPPPTRAIDMVVQVLDLRPGVRVQVQLPRDATSDELRQYLLMLVGKFPQIRSWLNFDAMFPAQPSMPPT